MNRILLVLLLVTTYSCGKDILPCERVPCDRVSENWSQPGNRVASFIDFRRGTWKQVRASASDTSSLLIFHNDSIWSLYGEYGGYYKQKYKFDGLYLVHLTDIHGNIKNPPTRQQTIYNDTTGVFSVLIKLNRDHQFWDHYIKID